MEKAEFSTGTFSACSKSIETWVWKSKTFKMASVNDYGKCCKALVGIFGDFLLKTFIEAERHLY